MSLVTQMLIVEQYGMRLDVEKLSKVLAITPGAIRNQISAATFPIPTYIDGGKRWADFRDVAEHLDKKRDEARDQLH